MASRQPDKPPAPRPIDLTIQKHQGSTIALDLMPNSVQASKDEPTPSLKEMIETMSRENGRLREELAYRQKLQELGEELRQDVDYVIDRLKTAVVTFQRGQKDIERVFRPGNSNSKTGHVI